MLKNGLMGGGLDCEVQIAVRPCASCSDDGPMRRRHRGRGRARGELIEIIISDRWAALLCVDRSARCSDAETRMMLEIQIFYLLNRIIIA